MSSSRAESLTMTIPEVAKALGISRGLAYELAGRDELPVRVIRLGEKRMVVPKRAFENILSGGQQGIEDLASGIRGSDS